MKIYLLCPDCLDEQARHELSHNTPDPVNTRRRLTTYPIDLTNESSYVVHCDFGHSSAILISLTNHEVLFETGVFAILDGYYREAITSFAASLERFFEFSIRTMTLAHGCPLEEENKCWAEISSQSERQLGAYIYLYAAHFKEKPPILSRPMIELRNSAVHKGHIPTLDKAQSFGEEVLSIISRGTAKLWKTAPHAAHTMVSEKSKESVKKVTATGAVQSGGIQQISSAIREGRSLEEHLMIMKRSHSADSLSKHQKILDDFNRKDRVK